MTRLDQQLKQQSGFTSQMMTWFVKPTEGKSVKVITSTHRLGQGNAMKTKAEFSLVCMLILYTGKYMCMDCLLLIVRTSTLPESYTYRKEEGGIIV